jgi:hypothetical protein
MLPLPRLAIHHQYSLKQKLNFSPVARQAIPFLDLRVIISEYAKEFREKSQLS